jgi:hypothetical protein
MNDSSRSTSIERQCSRRAVPEQDRLRKATAHLRVRLQRILRVGRSRPPRTVDQPVGTPIPASPRYGDIGVSSGP